MTTNDFIQIVAISKTGKTVTARMIASKILTGGGYTGSEAPQLDEFKSKPFTLHVKGEYLRGSYPYCAPNSDSMKMGSFGKFVRKTAFYNKVD